MTPWTVARLLCPWDSPEKNTGVDCHSFSGASSWPRDRTWVSCIAGGFFTIWATREALEVTNSARTCPLPPTAPSLPCCSSVPESLRSRHADWSSSPKWRASVFMVSLYWHRWSTKIMEEFTLLRRIHLKFLFGKLPRKVKNNHFFPLFSLPRGNLLLPHLHHWGQQWGSCKPVLGGVGLNPAMQRAVSLNPHSKTSLQDQSMEKVGIF